MKPYYTLDADNTVMVAPDFDAWMLWVRKHHDRMEVAITAYPHCHIRTVFLGVESSGEDTCPPSVFETVIIGGPHDSKTVTSTNFEEARKTHAQVSEIVAREALDVDFAGQPSPFQE